MRPGRLILSSAALVVCVVAGYYFADHFTAKGVESASVVTTAPLADDEVVTQIIPLPNNLHAVGRRSDLVPLTHRDADVTSSAVVIEDTSAKIQRLVSIVARRDAALDPKAVTEYRQLKHAEAGEMVRLLDAAFGPVATGEGGDATTMPARFFVGFDVRTNAVVLIGRKEKLKPAFDLINTVEGQAATSPATGTRPVKG